MELTRGQRGFTLVEALIAALVLGLLAIGILPLFTQAMVNNKQGSDSTVVTTFSKSDLETAAAVPFDAPTLTIAAGSTSLVVVDWYVQTSSARVGGTNGQWIVTCTGTTASCANAPQPVGQGQVLWMRTSTIQQFNVDDLTFSNPEDGGTSPDFVHLKRITSVVQRALAGAGTLGNALTAGKSITLQTVRSE
jgi:prepilin-type N-terminal cleavage/methylation domain-containing protein